MRRPIVLLSFIVVAALAVGLTSWYNHRPMVVERPSLGGPPPQPRQPPVNLVGKIVPAFSAKDLDGRRIKTDELRGRVVVINIWATWCMPCLEELPRLEREVWQKHRNELTVVAVARGEGANKVRPFNERAKLTFSLVPDSDSEITELFGLAAIPRTYVIDRSGRIVHQTVGYGEQGFTELVAAIERALQQT